MKPWALPPIAAVLLSVMLGCASGMQLTDKAPLYRYKADISVTVDGVTFDGMAVTKLDGPKDISIVSKAALDLLTISSCHRQFTIESVDQGWFGGAGHTYTYRYAPTEVEKDGFCPIYIQAFDKTGVTAWGYLGFRSDEDLPAHLECNGVDWKFAGVSVCQSKAGLRQEIVFDRPVRFAQSELCHIEAKTPEMKAFVVSTENGFCYATFTDGTHWHRSVFLGYDEVLVRDGK